MLPCDFRNGSEDNNISISFVYNISIGNGRRWTRDALPHVKALDVEKGRIASRGRAAMQSAAYNTV